MAYKHVKLPDGGTRISIENDQMNVPDEPVLGYIEGDGIGVDITPACLKVWDAAVEKAYDGKRKVHWAELFLGEKAAGKYDGDYFPDETLEAIASAREAYDLGRGRAGFLSGKGGDKP